jgi:transcriptional regulator with XRE-family HTH domain
LRECIACCTFLGMSESPTERVARTLRGKLAERRISGAQLARQLGWSQQSTSRRLNGSTPITVDDLAAICGVLQLPMADVVSEDVAA